MFCCYCLVWWKYIHLYRSCNKFNFFLEILVLQFIDIVHVTCHWRYIDRNLQNISFPTNDAAIASRKRKFHNIAQISIRIGSIDGALIPIIAPQHIFACRKRLLAIIVQATVGTDMRYDLVQMGQCLPGDIDNKTANFAMFTCIWICYHV